MYVKSLNKESHLNIIKHCCQVFKCAIAAAIWKKTFSYSNKLLKYSSSVQFRSWRLNNLTYFHSLTSIYREFFNNFWIGNLIWGTWTIFLRRSITQPYIGVASPSHFDSLVQWLNVWRRFSVSLTRSLLLETINTYSMFHCICLMVDLNIVCNALKQLSWSALLCQLDRHQLILCIFIHVRTKSPKLNQ